MKYLLIICLTTFNAMDLFSNSILETEQPLVVALESTKESLGINFVIKATNQQTVILRIRDRSRNIVFQKHFHGARAYKGILNLENLGNGKYFLEVRHSGQKFTQKLNLQKYSLRTVHLD